MAIYNKLREESGVIINLTEKDYKAYSLMGQIVEIVSCKVVALKPERRGIFYLVTESQLEKSEILKKRSDIIIAKEQGIGRNKTFLHVFYTIDKSTRVYPRGE